MENIWICLCTIRGETMTLRHLDIFVAVYQHQSITRAAEELFISQPAVSLAIKELEEFYHIRLFERLNKRLYVTAEGNNFYNYALRIVTLYKEMDKIFLEQKNQDIIHLGFGIAVGKLIMPKIIHDFQDTYPEIKVLVSVFNSQTIEDMITNNELDLGVLECSVRGRYLVRRILQVNPIVVICNRENPLASMDHLHIQDLAHENFLMRKAYSDTRVAVDSAVQNYKIDVQPSWESSSSLTLLNAVKENLGIAFLPLNIVNAFSDPDIAILDVEEFTPTCDLNFIHHKDKFITPALQKFIDFCEMRLSNVEE